MRFSIAIMEHEMERERDRKGEPIDEGRVFPTEPVRRVMPPVSKPKNEPKDDGKRSVPDGKPKK